MSKEAFLEGLTFEQKFERKVEIHQVKRVGRVEERWLCLENIQGRVCQGGGKGVASWCRDREADQVGACVFWLICPWFSLGQNLLNMGHYLLLHIPFFQIHNHLSDSKYPVERKLTFTQHFPKFSDNEACYGTVNLTVCRPALTQPEGIAGQFTGRGVSGPHRSASARVELSYHLKWEAVQGAAPS